jgi:hypothetical protein
MKLHTDAFPDQYRFGGMAEADGAARIRAASRTLRPGQTGVVAFFSIATARPYDAGLYLVVERL